MVSCVQSRLFWKHMCLHVLFLFFLLFVAGLSHLCVPCDVFFTKLVFLRFAFLSLLGEANTRVFGSFFVFLFSPLCPDSVHTFAQKSETNAYLVREASFLIWHSTVDMARVRRRPSWLVYFFFSGTSDKRLCVLCCCAEKHFSGFHFLRGHNKHVMSIPQGSVLLAGDVWCKLRTLERKRDWLPARPISKDP